MKNFFTFLLILAFATTFGQVEGTWKMSPEAGALGVGPNQGDIGWWSNSEGDIIARACYFDDEFEITADGAFQNVLQNETWIEGWQGGSDNCGTPVYPHNGTIPATWVYDAGAGTITLNGTGSYLGLPKAYNGGELTDPADAPESITYLVQLNATNDTMIADIDVGGAWWRFILTTNAVTPPPPDPIYLPVSFNNTGLDYKLTDFGGNWSSIIEDPDDATNMVVETFRDAGAQTWAGTTVGEPEGLAEPIPFIADYTTMSIRVYSPEAGIPILFKLEVWDNTGIFTEVIANTTVANEWETIYFDFSDDPNFNIANPYNKPIVFFNFGVSGGDAGEMTFMWDDIEYIYPIPAYTYNDFDENQNNEFFGDPVLPTIVANPDVSGINTSANCAEYLKSEADWAFVYTELDELINFENGTNFQLKVHSSVVANVTFKLENRYANWISVERTAIITDTSTWVLLNFDFSGEASETYSKIVIFFGFSETMGETFYFDDVVGPVYDTPKLYLEENVQDNFEGDGWSTVDGWIFQDPEMDPLTTTNDPENSGNTVVDYNRDGSFQYTNAQVELDHILDLTERNKFELMVYFPSSNDYTGDMNATAAIKLQNSLYIENSWWTQVEIVQPVTTFDEWVTLTFDFSESLDRTDFDKIVVQLGGEGHWVPAQFYFDNLYLKHVPYLTVLTPNGGEVVEQGEDLEITWDYNYWEGPIQIDLIKGDDELTLVYNIPASDLSFTWTVFDNQEIGDDYIIRISGLDAEDPTDDSDDYFAVTEAYNMPQIIISEIMYNPPESGNDSLEFLEFYNKGTEPINMAGFYMSQGVEHIFPSIVIEPDTFMLLSIDSLAFFATFGVESFQWTSGALSNGGEPVELSDQFGNIINTVAYDDQLPWDTLADGYGPSLELLNSSLDNSLPESWMHSVNFLAVNSANDSIWASPGFGFTGLSAAFEANNTHVLVGDSVMFTDLSSGTPTSWMWTFEGGTPATYDGQNPPYIVYSQVGLWDVTLTVSDGIDSNEMIYADYIDVFDQPAPMNLQAVVGPLDDVQLSWDVPATGDVIGYNVYRDGDKINEETVLVNEYNDQEPPIGSREYFVTALYETGESLPSNIVSVVVTDITEIAINSVVVYPNPTDGNFTISFTENVTIDFSVLDITGKEVFNSTINKTSSFDLSAAEKGIYFLRLLDKSSNSIIVKKLIIR